MTEKPKKEKKVTESTRKKYESVTPPVPPRPEIPMYDPQTGDINPYYEELTGKANPLAEVRKTNLIPPPYEPMKKNRFIVLFPEGMGVDSYTISSASRPSFTMKKPTFWSKLIGKDLQVLNPTRIVFRDVIGVGLSGVVKKLMNLKTFDYNIQMIDPLGAVVETFEYIGCKVVSTDMGNLDYSNDSLCEIIVTIQATKVEY